MVFATLYLFALKTGVGAETLAQFFKITRIDKYVGVSTTALRTKLSEIESKFFLQICTKLLVFAAIQSQLEFVADQLINAH